MPTLAIQLQAIDGPFGVIVEPWACPVFQVLPGQRCKLEVHHPSATPTVTNSVANGRLYVTVYEAGSTFSFWRDNVLEFSIPPHLALPDLGG